MCECNLPLMHGLVAAAALAVPAAVHGQGDLGDNAFLLLSLFCTYDVTTLTRNVNPAFTGLRLNKMPNPQIFKGLRCAQRLAG